MRPWARHAHKVLLDAVGAIGQRVEWKALPQLRHEHAIDRLACRGLAHQRMAAAVAARCCGGAARSRLDSLDRRGGGGGRRGGLWRSVEGRQQCRRRRRQEDRRVQHLDLVAQLVVEAHDSHVQHERHGAELWIDWCDYDGLIDSLCVLVIE